jgi:hypothetical protein
VGPECYGRQRILWALPVGDKPLRHGRMLEEVNWIVAVLRVIPEPAGQGRYLIPDTWIPNPASQSYRIKPHGQLVRLSLTHYCASTWRLSTLWSSTNLQGTYVPGSLILRQVSRLDAFSGYLFRT